MKYFIAVLAIMLSLGGVIGVKANDQTIPNGIQRVGAPAVWPNGDVNATVAIIDTGVDPFNPDLNVVGGVDCAPQTDNMSPFTVKIPEAQSYAKPAAFYNGPDYGDQNGHGTHVAGIIAAKNNNYGVVGIAPGAKIWSVRVLDAQGSGTQKSLMCGLTWVRDHAKLLGIDVVNISLGGDSPTDLTKTTATCTGNGRLPDPRLITGEVKTDPERQAICDIIDQGVPVVAAAGNADSLVAFHDPAGYPEVIAVSNFSDFDGQPGGLATYHDPCLGYGGLDDTFWTSMNSTPDHAYTSTYGPGITIAAPGTCVLSTFPDDGFAYLTGTSMAAPHVTGAVALLRAENRAAAATSAAPINRTLSPAQIKQCLIDSGDPQPVNFGDPDAFHEPLLNVQKLIALCGNK